MAYNPNNPNGQATMANSEPVVLASDQSAVPVSVSSVPSHDVTNSGTFAVQVTSVPTTPVTGTFWQATQPVSGTFYQATQPVSMTALPVASVSATTADATASGDTTIVSITNSPRLYYISLSANGANSADVTAIVKIGATNKYKVSLKAGAIWARNIGAGNSYVTGASGEDIVVNLSAAQTVHVSVEYADV